MSLPISRRRALIEELLQTTSRTFALAIPLLPEPLRTEVGVGYLLFRIADTLEDAERLGRDERIQELGRFIELLGEPTEANAVAAASVWKDNPPSTNADYNRLMSQTPAVLAELCSLEPAVTNILKRQAIRSALGMAETLRRGDRAGAIEFETLVDLKHYCYFVAGIVGEMLTELFQHRLPPSAARNALEVDAAAFGEGLQLVNILKDVDGDARDGRVYLPASVARETNFDQARTDLAAAERYAENLAKAGADPGVVAFLTLPRTLALETLDVLQKNAGLKVDRQVVTAKLAEARAIATQGATQ